ncbi:MAG: hypothetical protein WC565_01885 [Parcubacteria group bacterium]
MEVTSVISAGASVLSFSIIVFIVPLVKYVISSKDKQIDELKTLINQDRQSRCESDERVRQLEMQVARYGIELEVTKGIQSKLDGISGRVEDIAREMSSVQTSIAFLARGRIVSVPRSKQDSIKEG